jgi:hypothetical protein
MSQFAPVATAMMFYGLVLFTFFSQLLGKMDAKTAGYTVFIGGFVGLLMGLYAYIGLNLAFPATLVIVFAITFISAGIWNLRGWDLKALAYPLMYLGIVDALYAIYFAIIGFYIWSILCWAWFIVYLVFVLALLTGKSTYLAFARYWCLLCAFVTLLIPAFLILIGVTFA